VAAFLDCLVSIFDKLSIPKPEGKFMLKLGVKAPPFRLKSDDDMLVSLADFKGQRVLLFLYPKANTSG
jgi:hypothetical protein